MKKIKQIIKDIKSIKIQGAEHIAEAGLQAMRLAVNSSKNQSSLKQNIQKVKYLLLNARPTEPFLKNSLNYSLQDFRKNSFLESKHLLNIRIDHALEHMFFSNHKIAEIVNNKLKDGMVIMTHCHSSTVVKALLEAKKSGKNFEVYCTETRPKFQGRITATELVKHKIKTTMFIDSAIRLALKDSDMFLFGADAITAEGKIVNKMGTELICEKARDFNVESYSCTDSWKFDPKSVFGFEEDIEKRFSCEIWKNPPKGLKFSNYAFEIVSPEVVRGIITEIGVYKPEILVSELRRKYPWIFI